MTERRHPTESVELTGRRATDLPVVVFDQGQLNRIERLEDSLGRIENLLEPISETYTTVSRMGKWLMAGAVFVSIIVGSVLGVLKIFGRK